MNKKLLLLILALLVIVGGIALFFELAGTSRQARDESVASSTGTLTATSSLPAPVWVKSASGAMLSAKALQAYDISVDGENQIYYSQEVDFTSPAGTTKTLYSTGVPGGPKASAAVAVLFGGDDTFQISPEGSFVSFTVLYYETGGFFLFDTKTGVNLAQQNEGVNSIANLNIDKIVWAPDDTWFALHQNFARIDASTDWSGVYVYTKRSGKIKLITPPQSATSSDSVGYTNLRMVDASHIAFEKVEYIGDPSSIDATGTVTASYLYDTSSGTLTTQ